VARTRSRRPEGATDRRSPLDLPRHEWQGCSAAWAALRQRSALRRWRLRSPWKRCSTGRPW